MSRISGAESHIMEALWARGALTAEEIVREVGEAQAWGELGNAQRITGDLLSSERALARALGLFHEGSQDPLLGARLLSLQASLLGDQRRFGEALDLLREVEETYGLFGETQQAASANESMAAVSETVATVDEVAQTSEQASQRARAVAESAQRASDVGHSTTAAP